jgi:SAM-dependent methyltransferase
LGYPVAVFVDESLWIRHALEQLPLRAGMRVLDIGSSSLHFRTVVQPHIDRNVFAPLRERGLQLIHVDAREEPGVDIIADVTTLDGVKETYDLVLCTNLLEHVVDREETVLHVKRVVRPAGVLVLTVPRRYPIHADPIDTGYRPDTTELSALLGWPKVLKSEVLTVRNSVHYVNRPWYRRWLAPWQIACLLAVKPA